MESELALQEQYRQRCREEYRQKKAQWLAELSARKPSTVGLLAQLKRLALLTDEALQALWHWAGLDQKPSRHGAAPALLAVGGYGRQSLFPHSDIDVLVLLPEGTVLEQDPELQSRIERFIGMGWDWGLELGSSVRTQSECLAQAKADITVQTALLEARGIAGSRRLAEQFAKAFRSQLNVQEFFQAKTLEMRQRHTKYENTPYALEPNVKESPGGLRDLHVILWVARAAGLGNSWEQLQTQGLATALEVRQLKRNEALLSLIRTHLHLKSRRREDRLVFDLQTSVAESFGYQTELNAEGRIAVRASEQLMRQYYWAAKAVTQLNQILLLGIEERLALARDAHALDARAINERFNDRAGLLDIADDALFEREPKAILETFELYQCTPCIKGLSARTLRALYNARRRMNAAFRADPRNRATLLRIFQHPVGITRVMRLMNQTSVLGRTLWVFRRIVGQMQHDLFHAYTVDQHILMVLRNVRRFFIAEHAHEYPFCSELAAGWDQPWLLYVAALFHDIAKGRGGDHSRLGEVELRHFCRQYRIAQADTELMAFLVREHLTLSHVAQKQDLSDPQVIQAFIERVGDERRLTALYLLTVADIRGTSPRVWNAWKGKLLEDLYRIARRALGGAEPNANAEIETRKREALAELALHAQPHEGHKALWDMLDVSYFMRHDSADIAWHARQLSRHAALHVKTGDAEAAQTLVRSRIWPLGEGLQVLVFTPDQADLFARICGYLDRAGFSILDARIHTTHNGYALDTFQIVAQHLAEHYRELITMVESGLAAEIEAAKPLPAPSLGRVSRRVQSFPVTPRVQLQPDEHNQRWLLSVSASDRKGLLYSIAHVLAQHHINLELAKVSTLGERIEDTFLLQGPALQDEKTRMQIETELRRVL